MVSLPVRFSSTALSNQSFLLNYAEDSTACLEKCKFPNGSDESNLDETLYYETKLCFSIGLHYQHFYLGLCWTKNIIDVEISIFILPGHIIGTWPWLNFLEFLLNDFLSRFPITFFDEVASMGRQNRCSKLSFSSQGFRLIITHDFDRYVLTNCNVGFGILIVSRPV